MLIHQAIIFLSDWLCCCSYLYEGSWHVYSNITHHSIHSPRTQTTYVMVTTVHTAHSIEAATSNGVYCTTTSQGQSRLWCYLPPHHSESNFTDFSRGELTLHKRQCVWLLESETECLVIWSRLPKPHSPSLATAGTLGGCLCLRKALLFLGCA